MQAMEVVDYEPESRTLLVYDLPDKRAFEVSGTRLKIYTVGRR